jgi:hypothetical protein
MKVSNGAVKALENKDSKQELPPLSLVPDEVKMEELDSAKIGSFKLLSVVTDTTSLKCLFNMPYADGSQSIRSGCGTRSRSYVV